MAYFFDFIMYYSKWSPVKLCLCSRSLDSAREERGDWWPDGGYLHYYNGMDDHFDICRVFEISKFDIARLTCTVFTSYQSPACGCKVALCTQNLRH